MISFSCGTYHGLFVDTGVPSVLPKDISYFDFRTRGGRTIPSDASPNLVLRYVSNVDTKLHMLMVSLVYRATEGNRQGFVAFGTLLYGSSFSSHEIDKGIQSAIDVAQGSSSFFNGKTISGRPIPQEGKSLDRTKLPLVEGGKFYGELVANINSAEALKGLTEFAEELISSGIDHYEIVVNPNRGMNQSDLLKYFNGLDTRIRIQEVHEKLARSREVDRKRQEKSLEGQRLIDRSKQNAFLIQMFAFGIVGTALIGLLAFVAIKFIFAEDQVEVTQPVKTELSPADDPVTPENDVANNKYSSTPSEDMEMASCDLDTLSADDQTKHMIITDLQTDGKCIQISENVTSLFDSKSLDQIIKSRDASFSVTDKLPVSNQRLLTTFAKVVDRPLTTDFANKYVDEDLNFVIPDEGASFAISMETATPKLICTPSVVEDDAFNRGIPKFEFYTNSENNYRNVIKWFSQGVVLRLASAYRKISKEMKIDDPGNSDVTSASNRLRDFGDNLSELTNSDVMELSTSEWNDDQRVCVIIITEEDEIDFYMNLKIPGEQLEPYSIEEYLKSHAYVEEKYEELVAKNAQSECQKIPGLFMVWNSGDGAAMVMDNAVGFSPYTVDNGQTLDFTLKPSKNYGSPVYKLPDLNKFDDLKTYFESDPNFSPFSPKLYSREDFCFSPTSVDP
tara:strand:- start:3643 stop:5670 length:2028 start_codon:yes stop_codon:yes gene_type:complete